MSDTASEIAGLQAALVASEARAVVSTSEAMIQHLRLEIAKLRREHYGQSSERRARLIGQLELPLEEFEAAAAEDEIAAGRAAEGTTTVQAFQRRRPSRQPFPEHLPRGGSWSRLPPPAPAAARPAS